VSEKPGEASDLELRDISKHFGSFVAASHINLKVRKGEFLSLLGPSGCGKTTTLRMIAGFVDPTDGQVLIKGKDVNDTPSYKRNVGMCFQNYALFPHLTVEDNLAFGLKLRKVSKEQIKEKVERSLDLVKLSGKNLRYPSELSGGEQQRVSLARALIIEPDVLLLDEPLSNLDAKLRAEMRIELKRIQETVGITSIFVTHDQEEALVLSDRIVVMNKGAIEQIGTPTTIYENPETEFVAHFIGEGNFFDGIIKGSNEVEADVEVENGRMRTTVAQTGGLSVGARVKFVVRPEYIHFVPQCESPGKNIFKGTIRFASYIGSVCNYVCSLDGLEKDVLVCVQGEPGQRPIAEETTVSLCWTPQSCTVFDTPPVCHDLPKRVSDGSAGE
jgi:putative spermidine/putrescine transport system ATP-binding protein